MLSDLNQTININLADATRIIQKQEKTDKLRIYRKRPYEVLTV